MWWIGGIVYVLGAGGTFVFNLAIIVGPVTRPLAVLRNTVLWPIFLPLLIWLFVTEG